MQIDEYLINSERLTRLLTKHNKKQVASFFEGLCQKVVEGLYEEKISALEQLLRSGKITDLAAFTDSEEEAYDRLYSIAEILYRSTKDDSR
jgi:hypothetical protein